MAMNTKKPVTSSSPAKVPAKKPVTKTEAEEEEPELSAGAEDDEVEDEDDEDDDSSASSSEDSGGGSSLSARDRKAQAFVKKANAEIEELRDEDGSVPDTVHNWLSAIGKKGRATPPKGVESRS